MIVRKVRKSFWCALALSLIGASVFYYAYFTKSFMFKQEDMIVKGPSTIKIGLFSDLHAVGRRQADGKIQIEDEYKNFLNDFSERISKSSSDIVIINGDVIEGTRKPAAVAMTELKLVQSSLNELPIEKNWLIGNHDLRGVTRSQWKEVFGIDYLDKSIEIDEYKIIFLDSNYGSEGKMNDSDGADSGLLLSDGQFVWLENELRNSDKIKIVFMHHPPITGDDVKPGYSPRGIKKIQEIFAKYGVVAVFSGHTERLAHQTIDNVNYFVFPGPTKFDFYPGAFESIRMIDKKAIVTLFSKNENGEYVRQKIE